MGSSEKTKDAYIEKLEGLLQRVLDEHKVRHPLRKSTRSAIRAALAEGERPATPPATSRTRVDLLDSSPLPVWLRATRGGDERYDWG